MKKPEHTPQGYPANNPTFDEAVRTELTRDAKKIAEGRAYLRTSLSQLRRAVRR